MTKNEKEFILWLHGFFEISNPKTLNEEQTALIRGEVEKFFNKVTPTRESPTTDFNRVWDELNKRTVPPTPPVYVPAPKDTWPYYVPLTDPTYPKITCGPTNSDGYSLFANDGKLPKQNFITC
jgi:hypothetical protein